MYLPKSKYSKPKYTQGYDFNLPNGKRYVGWCFETYKKQVFTGKEPSDKNTLLVPITETSNKPSKKLMFQPLASTIVDRAAIVSNRTIDSVIIPNSKTVKQDILVDSTDITNGYFLRYFLQDKITRNIIEVKNKKYIEMLKESYTIGITLKWIIKAPAENIKRNGYTYIGASQKNKEAVEAAEKTVIGIKNFIKSYDQFVN